MKPIRVRAALVATPKSDLDHRAQADERVEPILAILEGAEPVINLLDRRVLSKCARAARYASICGLRS